MKIPEIPDYGAIESFVLKYTFIGVTGGVLLLFLCKIAGLVIYYVGSGKFAVDIIKYVVEAIKASLGW